MEKRDLRHLKRKELIDLIDKMQTESDLVSNVEVKEELGRLKEREKYLKHLRKTVLVATLWMPVLKIYGSSMNPTLENGQVVVSIKTKKLKSGDVVAFWQGNKLLVKRVIAGPGQKVDIDVNGKVSVDGKAIHESYVDSESLGNTDIDFPHQVEESRWFCMGDNRESSIDSRSAAIGDISKEQIEGKVLFSVWPLNKIGIVK